MSDNIPPKSPSGPNSSGNITNRIEECAFDLEPAMLHLIHDAVNTGWSRAEVAMAITSLSDNYLLSVVSNEAVDHLIQEAIDQTRRPGRRWRRQF